MSLTIKNIKNPNYKVLLKLAKYFNIECIDINYYENVLEFYNDDKKLIGFINYIILPSMYENDRLFIRNLYYKDNLDLDNIIKSLCNYCKSKKMFIKTTFFNDKFTEECKDILFKNNFIGNNIIFFKY